MNTNPARAGAFTSEFIVTILGGIASFLIANGVPANTANNLFNDLILVYKGGVALIAIVLMARSYISSRTAIKQQILENQKTTP